MSFEIQELPDIIRVIVLLSLSKGNSVQKTQLKNRIDKVCSNYACIEMSDLDRALNEMAAEGLITFSQESLVQPTEQGVKLGKEWESLLLKKDPVIEVVAGLTDGSVTSLVVILSALVAGLATRTAAFAAFLTLAAVTITNFSSFLLGGITEDLANMITLQNLMNYSLGDIPDKKERDKSLLLVEQLFVVLHREISRSNLQAAIICSATTFLAGIYPILAYLTLPSPLNIILSLFIVAVVVGVFLVRYRSKKTKVHWKITLFETIAIVIIAVAASLLIGRI
ncbi:MAG TPA: VIT1/CCC1 transporter family protein [Candidatus Krumholzibacteriaceae bacterium]|nr:VIT1/CCC1 transporter family protein [Candidatus Krumholzibacteriaceae bacterium]